MPSPVATTTMTPEARRERLVECLTRSGQAHLVTFYDRIAGDSEETEEKKKNALYDAVMGSDLPHLNRVLAASLELLRKSGSSSGDGGEAEEITPPPAASMFDVEKEKRQQGNGQEAADTTTTIDGNDSGSKQSTAGPSQRYRRYEAAGHRLIAAGGAAVLLLAGGSGTRLGLSYPKGCFSYDHEATGSGGGGGKEEDGEESGNTPEYLLKQHSKSLFQFHCERLRSAENLAWAAHVAALQRRRRQRAAEERGMAPEPVTAEDVETDGTDAITTATKGRIQLLVMTSDQNHDTTSAFFTDNAHFGLHPEQVIFFKQGSLPVYDAVRRDSDTDADGAPVHRILMETADRLCVAPGGNGGVYQSLARATTSSCDDMDKKTDDSPLALLSARGVVFVQIFSVDNLLAKIADPLFYGYSAARGCHVTVKTTPKVGPAERVGVFARICGRWGVVEYTELGEARAALRRGSEGNTNNIKSNGSKSTPSPNSNTSDDLLFNCANIACHCCSLAFLLFAAAKMETETLYHAAVKQVTAMTDDNGGGDDDTAVRVGRPAVKIEAFIFDMFRYCNEDSIPPPVLRRKKKKPKDAKGRCGTGAAKAVKAHRPAAKVDADAPAKVKKTTTTEAAKRTRATTEAAEETGTVTRNMKNNEANTAKGTARAADAPEEKSRTTSPKRKAKRGAAAADAEERAAKAPRNNKMKGVKGTKHRDAMAAVPPAAAAATGAVTEQKRKKEKATTNKQNNGESSRDRFGILQVDRSTEFAPIKNATDASSTDNPATAAAMYRAMTTGWARALLQRIIASGGATATIGTATDAAGRVARARAALGKLGGGLLVEVSPLVSYAGEGLEPYTEYLMDAIEKAETGGSDKAAVVSLLASCEQAN